MIGKRVRHFRRYREIATILMKHGFAWYLQRMGLADLLHLPVRSFAPELPADEQLFSRIRAAIEELGRHSSKSDNWLGCDRIYCPHSW